MNESLLQINLLRIMRLLHYNLNFPHALYSVYIYIYSWHNMTLDSLYIWEDYKATNVVLVQAVDKALQ